MGVASNAVPFVIPTPKMSLAVEKSPGSSHESTVNVRRRDDSSVLRRALSFTLLYAASSPHPSLSSSSSRGRVKDQGCLTSLSWK